VMAPDSDSQATDPVLRSTSDKSTLHRFAVVTRLQTPWVSTES
jgi:hypothetical protein